MSEESRGHCFSEFKRPTGGSRKPGGEGIMGMTPLPLINSWQLWEISYLVVVGTVVGSAVGSRLEV